MATNIWEVDSPTEGGDWGESERRAADDPEAKNHVRVMKLEVEVEEMAWKEAWIHRLVEEHPAFQGLPVRLKEALKGLPSPSLIPLANRRRRRKFWKKNGVVIHACSREGYFLARALKEVGGDPRASPLKVSGLEGFPRPARAWLAFTISASVKTSRSLRMTW